MQEVDINKIKVLADLHKKNGKSWHFHILTPQCLLNTVKKYALILENLTDNETHICYSDEPYIEVGAELAKLLQDTTTPSTLGENADISMELSDAIKPILKRANELTNQKIPWHYHLLTPDCALNEDKGKWVIILEDNRNDEVLKAKYDKEPKFDLAALELLFYQQKKSS